MDEMTPRQRVLALLNGETPDRVPCFSGMGNITMTGLEQLGYKFPHCHEDAGKMADLAATSYKLFGYECAVVPYDMCVEAEVLGCQMNAYEDVDQLLYPTIKEKAIHSEEEISNLAIPTDFAGKGRLPVVTEAIRRLKQDVGQDVAIGAWVLGPFTLAGQLMDLNDLFKLSFKKAALVNSMLDKLADFQIEVCKLYQAAGADYITVREMGATTDILSPRSFRQVIQPHLKKIAEAISGAKILHICGSTNSVVEIMNECGYTAISVEQKNDITKTRETIGQKPLVFGNFDSFGVLSSGTPELVEKTIIKCLEDGVDAIWPSCDLWPVTPLENAKAMMETVKKYSPQKWRRRG